MLRTSLRQIEVFVATAQKGNVTQAAALVGITQSAASMALAEFENQLATRLFDRIGKRLALNEDGRALYPKAVEMVERAREMEGLFRQPGGAVDLRLGASSTIGNYLLPQILGSFRANRPGCRIELEVGNTQQVINAILHFEIDVGFVEGPCLHPDIEAGFWRPDELAICAAPGHPIAQPGGAGIEVLRAADWILRERGSGTREVVDQMLMSQLGGIRVMMELGGTEAIKRAVESGMGISCLPKIALVGAVERGNLVSIPTPYLQLTRAFHILVHKDKYRTGGMSSLIRLCQSMAAQNSTM
ncbi:LysR family transcriptional regulator [Massilia sp. ZL223]|uniref:LysR family transcriptional regulator n=1 Tax=Massilia sp. ZL223 TaxID=2824904 RepID=UPI001B813646|nr:LysR family transcriptional regulator [Massilia sp. ZL223]MBQ5961618.1 LysR family transcriptional regulator [Massilia sp. ZL223]